MTPSIHNITSSVRHEIEVAGYADDSVLVSFPRGTDSEPFSPEEAKAFAIALLEAAGYEPVEEPALTPATLFGAADADERAGWNLDALTAAIEYNRQARFSYEKASGPGGIIERRVLAPSELLHTRSGEPFVVGYDPEREDVRAFRLDRIVGYVEVS